MYICQSKVCYVFYPLRIISIDAIKLETYSKTFNINNWKKIWNHRLPTQKTMMVVRWHSQKCVLTLKYLKVRILEFQFICISLGILKLYVTSFKNKCFPKIRICWIYRYLIYLIKFSYNPGTVLTCITVEYKQHPQLFQDVNYQVGVFLRRYEYRFGL